MHFNKKTVFLGFIVLAVVVCSLPITRDELDWRWAESRDQADDFMRYSTDWPHGRHAAEARLRYDQRVWAETKKAMIREAYKKTPVARTNSAVRLERLSRLEHFFWNEVTNANTAESYQDYLYRYPSGQFAPQARRHILALGAQPAGMNGAPPARDR